MAGLSFTSAGATPSIGSNPALQGLSSKIGINPSGQVSSIPPAANALNNAVSPAPTTPVKRTTVNNVDGSSTSTEYHAPVAPEVSAPVAPNSGILGQSSPSAFQVPVSSLPPLTNPQNQPAASPNGTGQNNGTLQINSNGQAVQPNGNTLGGQTTFPGILGSLASDSQNGSQNATQAANGLLSAPTQNANLVQQAQDIGTKYSNEADKISNYGNALAGSYTNGAGLAPVSQGLAGAAQNTTANELQGLQSAENLALNPIDKELIAQNQAQSGLEGAGSIANTQQSNTQSGLTSATNAAAPSASYPFVFDPATGTYKNASTGGQMNAQDAAQAVLNGQLSYADAKSGLGYLGTTGESQLQSAILQANPNANLNELEAQAAGQQAVASAPYSAQASNINTAGTVGTSTAATGLASATQNYVQANTSYQQASGQASNLQSAMQGVNALDSQYANKAINSLQNQFGSAKYTNFITSLNETKQAYTNLLASVGASTPTVNGQQATDIFNEASTPAQINAAITALNQAAYAKLQPLYQQIGTYQQNLGTGVSGTSSGNGTGGWASLGE